MIRTDIKIEKKLALPFLVIQRSTSLVALITYYTEGSEALYSGVVLHRGLNSVYKVGEKVNALDANKFDLLQGSITLSNE